MISWYSGEWVASWLQKFSSGYESRARKEKMMNWVFQTLAKDRDWIMESLPLARDKLVLNKVDFSYGVRVGPGPRDPRPREPRTRGPGPSSKFKSGIPGPFLKLKGGTPGPPSKFKCGTPHLSLMNSFFSEYFIVFFFVCVSFLNKIYTKKCE